LLANEILTEVEYAYIYNFVTQKNRLIGLREVVYPIPYSQ